MKRSWTSPFHKLTRRTWCSERKAGVPWSFRLTEWTIRGHASFEFCLKTAASSFVLVEFQRVCMSTPSESQPVAGRAGGDPSRHLTSQPLQTTQEPIDHVPPNSPESRNRAAVMKTIIKGRSPHMCHVSRTHRVDWDWHFERVNVNSNISLKYVHTYQQIAHMSTKGSFTRDKWDEPMIVFGVVSESFHRSHMSAAAVSVPPAQAVAKRNHPFTDEASKYAGTSSKSQSDGNRECDIRRAHR